MKVINEVFDLVVIGGGINGAGIAADAAGRGLKVALVEKNDLASATSSKSSKLIHGGLRYLEHYKFKLVRQALTEREILLKNAPHIIKPLTFRLPHQPHLRPAWLIHIGLFLYNHLAKRVTLPPSKGISFAQNSPLIDSITKGFEYSDAWVDDARLVVLNALAAEANGASIKTQTQCIKAVRENNVWAITLKDSLNGDTAVVNAHSIVNAAGPWVAQLYSTALTLNAPEKIRLVKGSHIVVPRIHKQSQAYILQNIDQRIVFVSPFEDSFTLIGTTDVEYNGDASTVEISDEEIDYLLKVTNNYFKKKIARNDIVTTFSGVRSLLDDESINAQAVTRDYKLTLQDANNKAPILSVFGGKITTYRKLAEAAVNKLQPYFNNMGPTWTADTPLPGGDFEDINLFTQTVKSAYPWLPSPLCNRLIRSYGTIVFQLLKTINNMEAMGTCFGENLYQHEVNFLIENEWAVTVEDITWRRTKMGLYLTAAQTEKLKQFIAQHPKVIKRKS